MLNIKKKLLNIFLKAFRLNRNVKIRNINQKNLKIWDSLKHIELLLKIQKNFKINFKITEYENLDKFENIFKLLKKKLNDKKKIR